MMVRASQLLASLCVCHTEAVSSMRGDDYGPPLKPAEIMTHDGCACKKPCGTNVADHYGRCDWCYTKDGCGTSGLKGSWDYCEYSPMQDFESQHYSDKTAQLWSRITDPDAVDQSGPSHLFAKTLADVVSISMITPFDDQWEVLPPGREKIIHSQGVMCQFDLAVRPDSPFTGVLASGTQSGLIRLGSALSLDEPILADILPGFGIKFLRSGVHSAGLVGLRTAGKGGSYNFFQDIFSNHVAPDDALVKLNKFQQASGCIDMVGLSDVCSYTQDGQRVDNPVFPFELLFEPTGAVNFEDQKKGNDDLLNELAGIPNGTDIFEVRAFASPMDALQGNAITIGTLRTKGTCHRSLFGDLELFFRHQRMEEDFALAPDWIQQMEALGDPACVATPGPVSQWQCPGQAESTTTMDPMEPTTAPMDPTTQDPSESTTMDPSEPTTTMDPMEPTTAPVDPTTQDPSGSTTAAPVDPTTHDPSESTTLDPSELTTTMDPMDPTTAPLDPTTQDPSESTTMDPTEPTTAAPVDPTTPDPSESTTMDPSESTTTMDPMDPTTAPVDPTTTEPYISTTVPWDPSKPSEKECRTCNTICAPCKACTDSEEGNCQKCWHCWDWDEDELEDKDKDCDALHKDHDWDDAEVRCLTNAVTKTGKDCRACWDDAPPSPPPATTTTSTTTTPSSTSLPPAPQPDFPGVEACRTCMTTCSPCRECADNPDGSFAYGSCSKCWHCWDWDDDELGDKDMDMDKDCDALHKDHDWDDAEVRCLTNSVTTVGMDCRACWGVLGDAMLV